MLSTETGEIVMLRSRSGKQNSSNRPNETAFRTTKWTANTRYCGVGRAGGLTGYTREERK
jgi:hypothetical protein